MRIAGGRSREDRREGRWVGEWDQQVARGRSVGNIAGKSRRRRAMGRTPEGGCAAAGVPLRPDSKDMHTARYRTRFVLIVRDSEAFT
jgi:hypothetical protein